MKKVFVLSLMVIGIVGCSTFRHQTLTVSTGSVTAGEGNSVTFKGKALPLQGKAIRVGDRLPQAMLTATDLSEKNISDTEGKVRIISVVPSLDTPVCEQQTHALSEKNGGLDKTVQFITVSMDLPFAQKRFSDNAKIHNMLFLSDYRSAAFGKNFGLLIKPLHLLSRSVLVVDKDNVVRYIQIVPEITQLPDLKKAMEVAKGLI
ncbi:thiol peroxidase [Nitrospira defluvii]|nr:thiol peroxidase [Nitrospira defluvii]